jgi:hypothetical protein
VAAQEPLVGQRRAWGVTPAGGGGAWVASHCWLAGWLAGWLAARPALVLVRVECAQTSQGTHSLGRVLN